MDLADSKTFDGICVDLGRDDLKGLRYSEDRFKLIFEGLGRFLWCKNGNRFGWVWEDLDILERL